MMRFFLALTLLGRGFAHAVGFVVTRRLATCRRYHCVRRLGQRRNFAAFVDTNVDNHGSSPIDSLGEQADILGCRLTYSYPGAPKINSG
jgi:hypothetical protein